VQIALNPCNGTSASDPRRKIPQQDWDQAKIDAWRKEHDHAFKEWAKSVLADTGGLRQQLSFINTAFVSVPGVTKPLMQVLIEKMKTNQFKTQSEYFLVCLAYRNLKYYEAQALGALGCAYKIEHPNATEPQVKSYLQPYQAVYEKQIADTVPLLKPLKRFWTERLTNVANPTPITWDKWHVVYVDRHKVWTEDGCILVGLQFYKKGNRVALEITQAQLDKAGDINASSKRKIRNNNWEEEYFQIGANTEIQLMTTVLDPRCIATGVQLALDGNKLMVLLEYVPYDFNTRTADFKKRAWTTAAHAEKSPSDQRNSDKWFSSDPDGNVGDTSARGRVGTRYEVTPDPLSPITGVMLQQSIGAGGQMFALMLARIKTDFYSPDTPRT
jgi:hypothetical protein